MLESFSVTQRKLHIIVSISVHFFSFRKVLQFNSYDCIYVMNGTINESPQCPGSMYCCMLPTCALVIDGKTKYGHCRPARTCPGIVDTVHGVSVGCKDPINVVSMRKVT